MIFRTCAGTFVKCADHIHHTRGLVIVKVQRAASGAGDKQFPIGREGHSDLVPAHLVTAISLIGIYRNQQIPFCDSSDTVSSTGRARCNWRLTVQRRCLPLDASERTSTCKFPNRPDWTTELPSGNRTPFPYTSEIPNDDSLVCGIAFRHFGGGNERVSVGLERMRIAILRRETPNPPLRRTRRSIRKRRCSHAYPNRRCLSVVPLRERDGDYRDGDRDSLQI